MSTENNFSETTEYNGRVKWFNKRAGFGFITCMSDEKKEEDVFVHHTGVKVESEQYRYLVQGEYVTFTLTGSENEKFPYQATNVRGAWKGDLMCETRKATPQYTRKNNNVNARGSGPRGKRDTQENSKRNTNNSNQ